MTIGNPWRESNTLIAIRKLLLGTLIVGVVGTSGELILLGHTEMPTQWIPIVALGALALVIAWHIRRPSPASVRAMQAFMGLFVATGVLGVGLHLNGNVEFERELHPTEGGFQFFIKTITGATPVLAPGSMVLLGLVGFAHTYRHPCTAGGDTFAGEETSS
jgi:hypothetical protein